MSPRMNGHKLHPLWRNIYAASYRLLFRLYVIWILPRCFSYLCRHILFPLVCFLFFYKTLHVHCKKKKNSSSADGYKVKLCILSYSKTPDLLPLSGVFNSPLLIFVVVFLDLSAFTHKYLQIIWESFCKHRIENINFSETYFLKVIICLGHFSPLMTYSFNSFFIIWFYFFHSCIVF